MCTNFGAFGRSLRQGKGALIAGTSDDPYDLRTRVVVRHPSDGYRYIGTQLAPVGVSFEKKKYTDDVAGFPTRGVNEAGLGFSWTLVAERSENKSSTGSVLANELWREMITRCATVDEAIALIKQASIGFGATAMVADRAGGFASLEIGRKEVVVRDLSKLESEDAANVNCWIDMHPRHGEPVASVVNPDVSNFARYNQATTLLNANRRRIDVSSLAGMLADHAHKDRSPLENAWLPGHGFSICNHGTLGKSGDAASGTAMGSVSAEIIDPSSGVFWYAYGWPCGEAPEFDDQLYQARSWGLFIGFALADMPDGELTTYEGDLTAAALKVADRLLWLTRDNRSMFTPRSLTVQSDLQHSRLR